MKLQEFLRAGNKPESLTELYAIKVKRHGEFPNLVFFKYDQLDSPMGEKIVQECRGVILDEDDNWNAVSRPYDKFFNYGEGHAQELDWETAEAYEKLDGSLMSMFFYRGEWRVASNGTPDAMGEVAGFPGLTFKKLFWDTFNELGYKLPDAGGYTYIFELMTPYNRVVVPHKTNRLVLHGVRSVYDGMELDPQLVGQLLGYEVVQKYYLNRIEDIIRIANELNGFENEGFVVVDAYFNRVKVKSPQYVAIAHLKEGFGTRRLLEIIRTNESQEFLAYFPEWTDKFIEVESAFNEYKQRIADVYESIKDIEVQKDFALQATKHPFSGALFALRNGKTPSVAEYLRNMNIKHLLDALKLKNEDLSN